MEEGEINQISIPVADFNDAKKFYEAIFDWNVDIETYSPNYAIVKWENKLSLGFYKSSNIVQGGPMLVFSVSSIDELIKKIETAGGEILQGKHDMSDNNFGIVFKDVFKNRFRAIGK